MSGPIGQDPGRSSSSGYVYEPTSPPIFDLGRDPVVDDADDEPLHVTAFGLILFAIAVTAIATAPAVVIFVWRTLL